MRNICGHCSAQETLSHAEPGSGEIQRRAIAWLRNDGGDGPAATQAAVFSRAIWFKQPLQQPCPPLVAAWPNLGKGSDTLKLKADFGCDGHDLKQRGHEVNC